MSQAPAIRKQVTVRDIARKAGISTATVSRVLNGQHVVKSETKERVLAVLKKEKYSMNVHAAAPGRLNRSTGRKRDFHPPPHRETTPPKMAFADALDEIRAGTEVLACLMREFSRLQRLVEVLANAKQVEE